MSQAGPLFVAFYAFCDDGKAEAVGYGDDCVDDGISAAGVADAINEGAVDLEALYGELIELAEGRVAGAEVVDGEGNADLCEEVDLAGCLGEIAHHSGLCDLHAEEVGIDVMCGQSFEDVRGEVGTGDLEWGDVDVDADRREALLLPAG